MHFALPPRKASHPPPFAPRTSRSSILPSFRRTRLKGIAVGILFVCAVFFLISRLWSGGETRVPTGSPAVVIVTLLDSKTYSKAYIENIVDNRNDYAAKHGYKTFFPSITDYDVTLSGAPSSWARVTAVRHALTKYPHCTYVWFLEQNSLIMNPELTVERHIMDPKRMEKLMMRDQPVVLPQSVIKTFPHLKGSEIDLAMTQDKDGLAPSSFVLRKGEWAKFFLDTWFDPLYRSYNFQKAETHALEHIVQWHPTVLSKLAIIPQKILNAYNQGDITSSKYQDGDFVIRFPGCEATSTANCEIEAEPFSKQWRTIFRAM